MKILWFPRLQQDTDRLHLVTWREMARALEARGHVVCVAVAGLPRADTPPGWIRLPLLRIRGLRLAGFWLAGAPSFLWHWLRFRPDLVILDVHSAVFGFPLAVWPRRSVWLLDQRTPIEHTSVRRGRLRAAFDRALTGLAVGLARRWFDGLTVITESFRANVAECFGVPAERIGVWGSGVDPERFAPAAPPAPRPPDLRGRFLIVQHGELSTNRGLLETARALAEPGLENAALLLLGQGPAREAILRTARECGVEDRVRILPAVPHADVPGWLAACDCAVMAYPADDYWNRNHPIKFAEFLAMGKVVVCTPLAVVREAGEGAPFLEVIPDHRPESIAAGIRRCMDDPDLAARGRAGNAHVRANGSWGAQADRLLEFVRDRQTAGRTP